MSEQRHLNGMRANPKQLSRLKRLTPSIMYLCAFVYLRICSPLACPSLFARAITCVCVPGSIQIVCLSIVP